MRLAFSTLGCPEYSLDDVVALAKRTGWTGLELRTAPDDHVHVGLSGPERAEVRDRLQGVAAACLATYVRLGAPDVADATVVRDLVDHAVLAVDLGAPAIRVFPGWSDSEGPERAVGQLRTAAGQLPPGVSIWLETHQPVSRGADVAAVLAEVNHPRVRALWDLAHPYIAGESVDQTAQALAPWLAHVQLKDAASLDDLTPVRLGEGVIPLREALAALTRIGYDGWLSLEWERRWYPDAEPLEPALLAARSWLGG